MNYSEAIEYISTVETLGIRLGIDCTKNLLARLGNPQNSIKILHIAGTNGKGSVSCFLTNILIAAGYQVGTFNSPAVFEYNEKILFNNTPITNDDVAKYITAVAEERDKMKFEGLELPTAFELEFAAALLYFKDKDCTFGVLECGLGGKTDATNAVDKKELAVITSISLDHTGLLGDTLEKIASEKFGIVKNCPLITYRQRDEVMGVLGKAEELILCDEPRLIDRDEDGQTVSYKGLSYRMKMFGSYQAVNCALAIESAHYLATRGYPVSTECIKKGILSSMWKGRMQIIHKNDKTYILDGAHNPDGAMTLTQELKATFKDVKKCFIFGMFKDKDVDGVLCHIGSIADEFIAVKPPTSRGLDETELLQKCLSYSPHSEKCNSIENAITKTKTCNCELIVVCGSLSLLSPAYDAITKL